MSLRQFSSYTPLRQGIIFGVLMFVFSIIYQSLLAKGFSWKIVIAAFVGALIGGLVYGTISWLRKR